MASNSNLYDKIVLPAINQLGGNPTKMYKGFSTISGNTENYNLYDFDLIKQDILNHFHTRQGERLMNPAFGCAIWDILFEPLTESVKDIVLKNVNTIVNYDPRVQAENVVVTSYDTGIQIELTLLFVPYNLQQSLQLQFDQTNGLVVR
jgi:phage baseplate assembly protein W